MKKNTNVLFIWDIDRKLKDFFRKTFKADRNITLVFPKKSSGNSLKKLYDEADVVVGWRPSQELLFGSQRVKLFINPGTGIKHHIENFRGKNIDGRITLVNSHGHAYSTAQHAVALLLALTNRIVPHHNLMQAGIWNTSDDRDIYNSSITLRKRKIGLLGYGAINRFVHSFLSGFDNEIHILKTHWKDKRTAAVPYSVVSNFQNDVSLYDMRELNRFLKIIDILIIAVPHTDKTEGMIGASQLRLLGKSGLLVNVARGKIVDERSLFDALSMNIISGAAIDVWYNYNPQKDKQGKEYPFSFPFQNLPNIVMSPHRAASPFDDIGRWDDVIENIRRASQGRKDYLNIVDIGREY